MRGVVGVLAEHRILRTDEAGRWEIFHDVLAGAVLGWKSRYDAEQAVSRARADARRRHRRLAFLAFGALVALAAMTALAVFAFSQRSEARDQARSARSGQLVASSLSVLDSDPELGIALALEAARIEPTPRAEDALRAGARRVAPPRRHPDRTSRRRRWTSTRRRRACSSSATTASCGSTSSTRAGCGGRIRSTAARPRSSTGGRSVVADRRLARS